MEFKELTKLKSHNSKAYTTLVKMWTTLSRCSSSTARSDLKDDLGFRYKIVEVQGRLTFSDLYSGDSFQFTGKDWE
jgi:hypothetical protein